MTPALSAVNVAAFVLQVTVIVSAGALLLRLFRIDAPGAVLAFWRVVLLACLTLPFLQPRTIVDVPVTTAAVETTRWLRRMAEDLQFPVGGPEAGFSAPEIFC